MRHRLILIIPIGALLLFLAVQLYMVNSILQQKEEMIMMQYKSLSKEGLSMLVGKKKANGFEKAMDITDKFTGLLVKEEMHKLSDSNDSSLLKNESAGHIYSIISKNEHLSEVLRSYIIDAGYDNDFDAVIFISRLRIFSDAGEMTLIDEKPPAAKERLILVNTFREERNNFDIEFSFLIDLTNKNELVFREAFISLMLILASIIIVISVFWLTWRNLVEERRLSELKTDFINNMTHELKTPLSTITVAGRTLEKEQVLSDPHKVVETAKLIGKQSVHLNQLINTILETTLLERTEFELSKQMTDLNELTHQVVTSFLTSCDGCAVAEECYEKGGVNAMVDVVYYTTMINNLLSNAVRYCTRQPLIKVVTGSEDGRVSIQVTDNGIGIAREHLDHIFDKFYRVPHGNIHRSKGLGLGLYYVRRIVEGHGGLITVTSKQGSGTTFKIILPK